MAIDGYTFNGLKALLEPIRGRPIGSRTLYAWLAAFDLVRDECGLYSEADLAKLSALAQWLQRPGATINQFKNLQGRK